MTNLKKQTLSDLVYEKIRNDILSGVIKQGEKLTELKIAEQMGVSQTPIRESFKKLSSVGLIKLIPWKGAVVLGYSQKQRRDTYECRSVLEQLAVESAISNMKQEDLDRLKDLSGQYEMNLSSADMSKISTEIHDLILEMADNEKLTFLLEQLKDIINHDRNISSTDEKRQVEIMQEHNEIIKNMEMKDVENAKKSLHRHIMNGFEYIYKD